MKYRKKFYKKKPKEKQMMGLAVPVYNNNVELALKHDIRIFWLGARTTVNPFAVQEIADSMKGIDIELWVKNPIIPDIKLWAGAIERFKIIGLNNVKTISFYCITLAMASLGLSTNIGKIKDLGVTPICVGLVISLAISLLSYLGIHFIVS